MPIPKKRALFLSDKDSQPCHTTGTSEIKQKNLLEIDLTVKEICKLLYTFKWDSATCRIVIINLPYSTKNNYV